MLDVDVAIKGHLVLGPGKDDYWPMWLLKCPSYKGQEVATSNVIGPLTLYFIGPKSYPMDACIVLRLRLGVEIKMAPRSNSVQYALLGLILSLIFIQISISNCTEDSFDRPLVAQTKTSTLLEPHYDAPSVFLHLRERRKRILWEMALLKRLARHRSTLLLRFGDVEKNPGPATTTKTGDKNKKNKFLTVIHVNTRSLLCHFDDVSALMSSERPHISALSETWLDSSVVDGEVHIPGYTLFRFDRNRSGGGVAMYCADNLPFSVLSCSRSSSGVESLWISVRLGYIHPSHAVGCFIVLLVLLRVLSMMCVIILRI